MQAYVRSCGLTDLSFVWMCILLRLSPSNDNSNSECFFLFSMNVSAREHLNSNMLSIPGFHYAVFCPFCMCSPFLRVPAWAYNNIRSHWHWHIGTFGHQNQWQKWVLAHIIIVLWSNLASKLLLDQVSLLWNQVCVCLCVSLHVGFR